MRPVSWPVGARPDHRHAPPVSCRLFTEELWHSMGDREYDLNRRQMAREPKAEIDKASEAEVTGSFRSYLLHPQQKVELKHFRPERKCRPMFAIGEMLWTERYPNGKVLRWTAWAGWKASSFDPAPEGATAQIVVDGFWLPCAGAGRSGRSSAEKGRLTKALAGFTGKRAKSLQPARQFPILFEKAQPGSGREGARRSGRQGSRRGAERCRAAIDRLGLIGAAAQSRSPFPIDAIPGDGSPPARDTASRSASVAAPHFFSRRPAFRSAPFAAFFCAKPHFGGRLSSNLLRRYFGCLSLILLRSLAFAECGVSLAAG